MEKLKIYQTDPWMVPYFVDKTIPYLYTHGTALRTKMRCILCWYEKDRTVDELHRYGFACPRCGDGVSYPNKFMLNVLSQLEVCVETEKCFEWSCGKKYDDYLEQYSLIIENHGEQHYKKSYGKIFRTFEEQITIDNLKRDMALENGIIHYVEIDCRKSDADWIKQSIMDSDLPHILSFTERDIDWTLCDQMSRQSLVVKACDLWQRRHKGVVEIAQELHVCRLTAISYLKQGASLRLCDYDPKAESQKILIKGRTMECERKKCKPIAVYNTIGLIAVFAGAVQMSEASQDLFGVYISRSMITNVCNGSCETVYGLRLKMISKEEYQEHYNMFGGNINLKLFNPDIKYSSREKPVFVFFNGNLINIYYSRQEASINLTEIYHIPFTVRGITNVCLGNQKHHNGFIFKNATREEYEQYKMIEKNNIEVVNKGVI